MTSRTSFAERQEIMFARLVASEDFDPTFEMGRVALACHFGPMSRSVDLSNALQGKRRPLTMSVLSCSSHRPNVDFFRDKGRRL